MQGVTLVSAGAGDDGIAEGIAVPGFVAAFRHDALKHHFALAGFGHGSHVIAAVGFGFPECLADGLCIRNCAANHGILQHLGGIHMVHHGDGVLADHSQSPHHILAPLIIKHIGEHSALAEFVHHAHGAHRHTLQEVGGVLQRRYAPSGRVSVHNAAAGHCAHIKCRCGIAAAQLRGNHGGDFLAQELLQLFHAQNVKAFVRLFQAGILFDFFLRQRADGAAGIGGADDGVRVHFLEVGQFELLARLQSLVNHCNALVQTTAAAGAQNGCAVQDIHQVFPIQNSHTVSSSYSDSSQRNPCCLKYCKYSPLVM